MKCYVDVRVNAYVLGSGPPTLTVIVYWPTYQDTPSLEQMHWHEGIITDYLGREDMLFIGPDFDLSSEAWLRLEFWEVQRREDGIAVAVHPERDEWRRYRPDEYQTHRSTLEMELPAFTQAVTMAHQERLTEYGGRIGADESLPMLVADANQLAQFFISIGAYDHPDGPPAPPPPPYPSQ